jgi:hypothetical protein
VDTALPSTRCGLSLRAIIDHELRTFPIHDGMVIGSDPLCDIVITDAEPKHARIEIHYQVCRLHPVNPLKIELEPGATWLALHPGRMFVIGKTIFDCVPSPEFFEKEPEPPLDRHACPRCRTNLVEIDLSARYCPHCGAPLPADCPQWPVLSKDLPIAASPKMSWWTAWMPMWIRTRVARDPLFFARRTTVLAYINTLFNLGLKYEAGIDADRHSSESMRYYRKAADLGNLPARARLKIKTGEM